MSNAKTEDGTSAESGGWRRWVPWDGRASATDKGLMAAIACVVAFGLVMRPVRPFLIADHPVLLALLDGDHAAIGAAGAFAGIGELPLWQAILAGTIGLAKLEWLTWWAGRQWGRGILGYFTTASRAQRWANRAQHIRPWVLALAVVAAPLPALPGAIMVALAGWARMRLLTFLALTTLGALLTSVLVAGVGYGLGQPAVDVVLLVDKYAGLASLTIIAGVALTPLAKKWLGRARRPTVEKR